MVADFTPMFAAVVMALAFGGGQFVTGRRSERLRRRAKCWFSVSAAAAVAIPVTFFWTHPSQFYVRIPLEIFAGIIIGAILWGLFLEVDEDNDDDQPKKTSQVV